MTWAVRIAVSAALALCVFATSGRATFAAAETRRLCDRRVTYDIVPPGADVPAPLRRLSGVWSGMITFAGGSQMCVSVVVKQIFPDGMVTLAVTWNVSVGGREDINNFVSLGEAPEWPNKVENGELRIDSGNRWHGVHYYYVLKVPSEAKPDVMEGKWMTDTHPQPVVLHRVKR